MRKMRTAKKYFVPIGDAETAHLPKIFWFFATAMQKIRISKYTILSMLSHRVDGWREIPYFL